MEGTVCSDGEKGWTELPYRVGEKEKLYHVNLLKRYLERETPTELMVATVVTEELDDNGGEVKYSLVVLDEGRNLRRRRTRRYVNVRAT
jgi:hypothetical protein